MSLVCTKCGNQRYSNSSYCKEHHMELVKAYKEENRQAINEKNKRYMKERRGLYGKTCDICKSRARLRVDNKDNEKRGVLCATCRSILKVIESDMERTKQLINYVDTHKATSITPPKVDF